jgi:hypothetical protein
MIVYLLWHVRSRPGEEDDEKLIGVYSSAERRHVRRLAHGTLGQASLAKCLIRDLTHPLSSSIRNERMRG